MMNGMRGMGRLNGRGMGSGFGRGGMGDCQPGYDSILGVCLPSLSTGLADVQAAVTGAVATGVATTPGIQAAATTAAQNSIATKFFAYVTANPLMVAGGVALVIGALVYSGSSMFKSKA